MKGFQVVMPLPFCRESFHDVGQSQDVSPEIAAAIGHNAGEAHLLSQVLDGLLLLVGAFCPSEIVIVAVLGEHPRHA